nr:RnfABCDGE type electron transport complex subunit G [Oceanococcus sp. HetDA_MAG_MS8]
MSERSWLASMRGAGANLLGFGLAAVLLLASVHQCTQPQIAAAQIAAKRAALLSMLPANSFDNDLLADRVRWTLPEEWTAPGPDIIWRARKHGEVVAFILPLRATEGYSGSIDFLLALSPHSEVLGMRVVAHKETPGLGDGIEAQRSNWQQQFLHQGLGSIAAKDWRLRRDGGVFDQLSGATITTRAVVNTMQAALVYIQNQAQAMTEAPAMEPSDE